MALTGRDGGVLANVVELAVKAPATETYLVQECTYPFIMRSGGGRGRDFRRRTNDFDLSAHFHRGFRLAVG